MRVYRLIVYEGTPRDLDVQIGASMPDGLRVVREGAMSIRLITLPASFERLIESIAMAVENKEGG